MNIYPGLSTSNKCFKVRKLIDMLYRQFYTWVNTSTLIMKGTKVQTLSGRAVAGAWLVAWAIMAMGAIIDTHAHR